MRLLHSLVELKVNVEGTQERKNKISPPDFVYVLLGDINLLVYLFQDITKFRYKCEYGRLVPRPTTFSVVGLGTRLRIKYKFE